MREQHPATTGKRSFSRREVVCLLLTAITLLVWWPVVHCGFLNYDDPDYYTANPHVQSGLTWANISWAFTTGHASNWHPLTWLSLMLDRTLFGKGPAGPHFINLLFHTVNTVLLFLLLRRLTAATGRSALVAALFALHPLHVESVAWVAERKDVLSAFWGLLSLWAYAGHAGKLKIQGSPSKGYYWLALIFFVLGLMSKPMLVTLPLVMMLLDFWPLGRLSGSEGRTAKIKKLLREKIPFFVLSAVSCVLTILVQQRGGAVVSLVKSSITDRIENALVSYARYLGKAFWPATLATPYPLPPHWPILPVLLAFVLFVGLGAGATVFRKKYPFGFTGWFWFVIMLLPVIGLIQVGNAAMADRYTYLPLIGVFIILVWGAGEVIANWRLPQPAVAVLVLGLLLVAAWRTRIQISYWRDSGTLFTHALAVTKNNFVAENDLGTWLSQNGQVREAMDCYRRSLQINPDNSDALFNLGNVFARLGDWNNAIVCYRRAQQAGPVHADLLNNLGLALMSEKQFAGAATNFEAALRLKPDFTDAHNNLGIVLFVDHRYDQAAQQYREALRLSPDDPRIYANLGDALVRLGRTAEAATCYQESLRLDPGNASLEAKLRSLEAGTSR
ncbi:MAG TPA: tetratricopeptide repeat protein [Verrucomicrobiae bacterium]|nr:tetratricopeptide repeat protein [Verrucomicrobiae bacterium]